MSEARATASRAALLELRQEREVVQEGHRFLDEKRILLAREILRRLEEYEKARAAMEHSEEAARKALGDALGSHGLEYLQLHAPPTAGSGEVRVGRTAFLAMPLPEAELELELVGLEGLESEALGACARAYAEVARDAAAMAGAEAALLRLLAEYRRTERRVRALENLILPELRGEERDMEEVLEENEMEEAIRVRLFAGGRGLTS